LPLADVVRYWWQGGVSRCYEGRSHITPGAPRRVNITSPDDIAVS